jgi:serine/threonine-protein kinase
VGASSAPATPPRAAQKLSTLPGAKPDDKQFTQVGRYRILEHLGRGGMATVYKAHDPSIGRDVAIMFRHASLSEDAECRTRFLREARAAGGLSHPNIVVVHDVGEIEGRPYMAMEMLQGASLAEELEQNKRLMVRDVVSIGIQLARALDYAHSKGVIHRDIKPGNIMRERANGAVKVTDFGIAHVDESASVGEQRTRVGDVIGTPQYMSPEQTRGEKLDGRSDLFSAGIVLYQMLTGVRPFRGDSLVAIAT